MNRKQGILSSALALTMALSMSVPAFAAGIDTAGGTGQAPVTLTAEGATFSVAVPTSLPINVAADGTVATATDAKIVNNGAGAVIVTALAATGADDWELVDFDSADMAAAKVNSHKIAMEINGDKTTADDTISFTAGNWASIAGKNDGNTDELAITYNAKVPAQSAAISDLTVVDVVFTIDWDAAA